MKPILSWAIGIYVDGKFTGIARNYSESDPPGLYPTKRAAQLEIYPASSYDPELKGYKEKPVRVKVELA